MNNDLISREVLKENGTVIGMVNGQKMKVIPLSVIDNAPTVEERPQGKWIFDGCTTYCSECGYKPTLGGDNYCPNCGAKMKGGAE